MHDDGYSTACIRGKNSKNTDNYRFYTLKFTLS